MQSALRRPLRLLLAVALAGYCLHPLSSTSAIPMMAGTPADSMHTQDLPPPNNNPNNNNNDDDVPPPLPSAPFRGRLGRQPPALDNTTDCAFRTLAYEFAVRLCAAANHTDALPQIFAGLQLNQPKCGAASPAPPKVPAQAHPHFPIPPHAHTPTSSSSVQPAPLVLYVVPRTNLNLNKIANLVGSEQKPLPSLPLALARLRTLRQQRRRLHGTTLDGLQDTIVLRQGVHYLNATLQLDERDANLTIQNYPGEDVWISGGVVLDSPQRRWELVPDSGLPGAPIVRTSLADLPLVAAGGGVLGLNEMFAADPGAAPATRFHRARHPNLDPLTGSFEQAYMPSHTAVMQTPAAQHAHTVLVESPSAVGGAALNGKYWTIGVGGPCERYTPPAGFLCSANTTGGGFGFDQAGPLFPTGMTFNTSLVPGWPWPTQEEAAVVKMWTNGWCTSFFEAAPRPPAGRGRSQSTDPQASLDFEIGGFQTGRGWHTDSGGNIQSGDWLVENARALLDAPGEFFYDPASQQLYVFSNSSGRAAPVAPAAPGAVLVVPVLKTLIDVRSRGECTSNASSSAEPVRNVRLQGLGFRDTQYTYMDEHLVPSGGDWALQRGGAIFLRGVDNVTLDSCRFRQLDGNAVFLNAYTRRVSVLRSVFQWIGASAVAALGETFSPDLRVPPSMGIDGTRGTQPRLTQVSDCICSDIGVHQKQSSCFFQARSCQSTLQRNIFYNVPRAAINLNDNFGGGNIITDNLSFGTCRESGDHGNINTWGRMPFLTDVRVGTPSVVPADTLIAYNMFIADYESLFGVDNDDSSSWYNITQNVFLGGGGLKSDYSGHDKHFSGNMCIATALHGCLHTSAYIKGHPDVCEDNIFVQAETDLTDLALAPVITIWFCNASDPTSILTAYGNEILPEVRRNRIYNLVGSANVTCGYHGPPNATTVPLQRFLDAGLMAGTTVDVLPSLDTMLGWARGILSL